MSLSLDTVPVLPLNVRVRNVGGTTIVGGYQHVMELSETAGFIWRRIDGTRTVAEIGALVAKEYDIDEATAIEDTAALLAELAEHELVRAGQ